MVGSVISKIRMFVVISSLSDSGCVMNVEKFLCESSRVCWKFFFIIGFSIKLSSMGVGL